MAVVPHRSGLLADVSNNDSPTVMKSFVSKIYGYEKHAESDDGTTFSPRTDLANKLSHASLIADENNEAESNSPPLSTPSRRTESKRNTQFNSIVGRLSPLAIADEQTKYPGLDDSLSQKTESTWSRGRSSTFTELSLDSGFGSSSMQSWTDSQKSQVNSPAGTPSVNRQLAVINETSNFPLSPVFKKSQSASKSPSTPQHRVFAARSRRNSPLTTSQCSPSPSLPQHIQALVRGTKNVAPSFSTSPTCNGVSKKSLSRQGLFSSNPPVIAQSKPNRLKRVATSVDGLNQTAQRCSMPFSPFSEAKKLRQLESIKEDLRHDGRCSLTHSQSSSVLAPSVVTVTKSRETDSHQAPPDTCMIGDGTRPYLLPCKPHESTVLIECSVLANLLDGKYQDQIKRFHIIDCRYPYEHDGGHILGAVNRPKAEPLLKEFFDDVSAHCDEIDENGNLKRTILIFHCEFSSKRAPDMVKAFRQCDRHRNRHNYPKLDFPEVYMLKGGYKAFYDYCCSTQQCYLLEPFGGYTPMHAEEHNHELRRWKKYKTMSAIEDRLVKTAVGQSALSPLSSLCAEGISPQKSTQQSQNSLKNAFARDENNRQYRIARRNPTIRRQLSMVNHGCDTSPVMKRCESSIFPAKTTPLFSRMLEDDENWPPQQF